VVFLLLIPAWILILSLLAGACVAARAGDSQQQADRQVVVGPIWEAPEPVVVSRWSVERPEAHAVLQDIAERSAA